eukprot:166207-Hanusia_phi.AAC.1
MQGYRNTLLHREMNSRDHCKQTQKHGNMEERGVRNIERGWLIKTQTHSSSMSSTGTSQDRHGLRVTRSDSNL